MRCCIGSIPDNIEDTWFEGQVLSCLHGHGETMIIKDATIKWVGPKNAA